jgi:hypothetical protein
MKIIDINKEKGFPIMKIVDEVKQLDSKRIEKELKENLELISDLIYVNKGLIDEYTMYRMIKAVERIEMYLKEVKLTIKG